ncbi:MAG: hypothetical protein GF353_08895 [Candidatus Lokiarchaeota archaeon]|nr:hypothetical protein [Candidatus Lokiarchaeota archaeon]
MNLEERLGSKVRLEGIAQDAKGGAVLITNDREVIYVKDLDSWDSKVLGEKVTLEGFLKKEKFIPDPRVDEDGAISAGAIGEQYILETYEIL